jgi:hypothetical protein
MTQPSGPVLELPSHHGTSLRSSPIFCALDALTFLIKVAFSQLCPGVSWLTAVTQTIRQRYSDVEDEAEGIQSLEKINVTRWVFLLVGTLGPTVKMAAMEGIPWRKAWGMMYLSSFLVVEPMVFARRLSEHLREDYHEIPRISRAEQKYEVRIKAFESFDVSACDFESLRFADIRCTGFVEVACTGNFRASRGRYWRMDSSFLWISCGCSFSFIHVLRTLHCSYAICAHSGSARETIE